MLEAQRLSANQQTVKNLRRELHLLPRVDHTSLIVIAAVVGLWVGLAATLLRVSVRLLTALFREPWATWALLSDAASLPRARLLSLLEMTPWRFELI